MKKTQKFLIYLIIFFGTVFLTRNFLMQKNIASAEDKDLLEAEEIIELKDLPLDVLAFMKESWEPFTDENVLRVEKSYKDGKFMYELKFEGNNSDQIFSVKTTESGVPIEIKKQVPFSTMLEDIKKAVILAFPDLEKECGGLDSNIDP